MSSFVDRAVALLVWVAVVVATHPVESVIAGLVALFVAMAAYKTVLRAEAWISRHLAERRGIEAMWAQVDQILSGTVPTDGESAEDVAYLPDLVLLDRTTPPLHREIKRRALRRFRRRPMRRPTTSSSDRSSRP